MKKIIAISTRILTCLLIIYLTGCSSANKQIFKARQVFDKYPGAAATYCGDKFPVADSVIRSTTDTVKGKSQDYGPVILSLSTGLDSAKNIIGQKQTNISSLAGQLAFSNGQLAKANAIIVEISASFNDLRAKYKPCGVDTIKSTSVVIRSNTAKIDELTVQLLQANTDKEKLQNTLATKTSESSHRFLMIVALWIIIGGYCTWKVYRFFTGGAVTGFIGR